MVKNHTFSCLTQRSIYGKNIGMKTRRTRQHQKFTFYPALIFLISVLTGFYCGCQGETFNLNVGGTNFEIIEKSGELTENEIWDGRVYITDTVTVPEGITLTIRAGTIVGFEPIDTPSLLIVKGELYAEGSPDRMIVFGSLGKQRTQEQEETVETTASPFETDLSRRKQQGGNSGAVANTLKAEPPRAGDWAGIQIETTSPNTRITYTRIQHANVGVRIRTDAVQIERCLFGENRTGIICENTNPTISNSEFNRNGIGSKFQGSAASDVEYSEFTANQYGVVCEDDSRPRIQYNILRANYENAIVCYSTASPEIVSNNITNNVGWAVYDGGRLRDNFIQGNKQVGGNITELGVGTQSEQFYGVEEVFEPRNSPVAEAGVPRENF